MANVGNLSVNLALESAQFIAGMKKAAAQTAATSAQISKALDTAKTALVGLAAAFAVDRIAAWTKASFDLADAIVDLSDRTGFSTKTIQEFGYAAQLSGSSVESASGGLEKFSKLLGAAQHGSQAAIKTLRDLGVTSKDNDIALRQAADGISKLGNRAEQAAATTTLFGKKAQDLTVTLASGSAGLDGFAQKAAELGIVLDEDLARNAGQVNDKLDTLRMIVTQQFAATIVKNADAIASLADNTTKLASALLSFWSQNPRAAMTIMGAIAGGAVGGLPGAAVGGIAGFVAGSKMAGSIEDGNNDIRFRQQKMREARANYHRERDTSFSDSAYLVQTSKEEFQKQIGLLGRALAAAKAGKTVGNAPGGDSGTLDPVVGTGKTAAELAKDAADKEAQWQNDLGRANDEYLSARQALTADIIEQSAFEREKLSNDANSRRAQIDLDGPGGTGKYTAAQVKALKLLEDKIEFQKADLINQRENEELARQELAIETSALDNERDLLSGAQSLAKSSSERRAIGLRLVDLQYQQERLALEAIVASHTATKAEQDIAKARLQILDRLKGNAEKDVISQTMGPGAAFLDAIPNSIGEINDSLEQATVEGLGGLQDGLLAAIKGTGDLKSAFSSLANSIIDGLIKIAIQQAIIKPLGEALFGGSSEGGGGGLFGSIFKSVLKVGTAAATGGTPIDGARANGGLTRAGRWLIGERGPEIVDIGNTANIIPHHKLRGVNGRVGSAINVVVNGVNDPAAVRAAARQAVLEAIPLTNAMASDYTMAKARQPRM